jgi:hypothetical protein
MYLVSWTALGAGEVACPEASPATSKHASAIRRDIIIISIEDITVLSMLVERWIYFLVTRPFFMSCSNAPGS